MFSRDLTLKLSKKSNTSNRAKDKKYRGTIKGARERGCSGIFPKFWPTFAELVLPGCDSQRAECSRSGPTLAQFTK